MNDTHTNNSHADATEAKAYELNHREAPVIWQVDILWAMLATLQTTGGRYSLIEEVCPKDSGPPPHWHDQDEAFYLIEGEITFKAGACELLAKAGSFVSIPRGTIHCFRVDSETARILNLYVPAGFEQVVIELGVPAAQRILPPKDLPLNKTPDEVAGLFEKWGMHPATDVPDLPRGRTDRRMNPE